MSFPTVLTPIFENDPSSMGKIHLRAAKAFDFTWMICQQIAHWSSTAEVVQLSRDPKYLYGMY